MFAVGARSRSRTSMSPYQHVGSGLYDASESPQAAASCTRFDRSAESCGATLLAVLFVRITGGIDNGSLWRYAVVESNGCIVRWCCCSNGPCHWCLANADGFASRSLDGADLCDEALLDSVGANAIAFSEGTLDPVSKSAQFPTISPQARLQLPSTVWWTYWLDSRTVTITACHPSPH